MNNLTTHYHHAVLIWMLFLIGEMLHIALQCDDFSKKSKQSYRAVLASIWIRVLYRAFACSMVFLIVWQYPDIIPQLSKMFGHPLGADESEVFLLPMNNALAGLWGLFLDSVLGYIPILKSQLPNLETTAVVN